MDPVKSLRLEEKLSLCDGADAWHTKSFPEAGIPSLTMNDGPHGLRKSLDSSEVADINRSVPATCFPTAVLSACSWDPSLLEEIHPPAYIPVALFVGLVYAHAAGALHDLLEARDVVGVLVGVRVDGGVQFLDLALDLGCDGQRRCFSVDECLHGLCLILLSLYACKYRRQV